MSKDLDYRHHYVARVIRDRHTGTVMLQLLDLDGVLDLNNGDECVTLATAVSLDGGRWAAGIAAPTRGDADLLDEVRALMAERARPDVFMDESTFLGRLHDLLDRPTGQRNDDCAQDDAKRMTASTTYERCERWTERARVIATCTEEFCTPERHIAAIRYLAIEAYDNGLLDGMRMQRERDA